MLKRSKIPVTPDLSNNQIKERVIGHPQFRRVKTTKDFDKVVESFQYAMDKKNPWHKRIGAFLRGENLLGQGVGAVVDIATLFLPFGHQIDNGRDTIRAVLSRNQKQTNKPMLKKILKLRNFVNIRDENGNFSWQELGASVLQIVISAAIVYGAVQLGIWDQLIEFINAGNGG
jgi:hypothetical protein